MRSAEGTGKNIEQAIQNALLELKASREDVDIKILNEGGFLKKAKVLVSISEDAIEKYEKKEQFKKNLVEEDNDEDFASKFIDKKIKKEEEKEKKEEKKLRIIADEEISDKEDSEEDKIVNEKKLTPEEFLTKLLEIMNMHGEIEKDEDEKFVHYNVVGEEPRELIGHHGEGMFALSYIMSVACKSEKGKKLVLDIGSYRDKRKESLTALAKRIADKVAKSGRYYKLEPMDASERKIIHTALQNDDRVTTLSKGEEPKRYLIVFPKEYKE